MPISIDFLANVNPFLRGAKDVEKEFDNVADALDDIAREGDQSTGKVGRSFKELADIAKRESKQAGDALKNNIDDGARAAEGDIRELHNEARQNLSETLSSFDGSLESLVDGVQGTLGGVVGGLAGPAGIFAAVAGAAGIGLVQAALTDTTERGEAFRQKVSEISAELIETGTIGQGSFDYILDTLKELATTTDEGATNLAELHRQARNSASGFEKIAQAYAGQSDQLDRIIDAERERLRLMEKGQTNESSWDIAGTARRGAEINDQKKIVEGLEEQQRAVEDAERAERAYLASGAPELERKAELLELVAEKQQDATAATLDAIDPAAALTEATTKAEEAERNRAQAVADGTEDSKDSWEDYAESVTASADAILGNYEKMIAAEENWQTNSATVREKYGDDVVKFFEDMGPQGKGALENALATWGDADWQRLTDLSARELAAAGKAGTDAYNRQLEQGLPKSLPAPKIETPVAPAPDMTKVYAAIQQKHLIKLEAAVFTRNGTRVY